MFGLVTVKNKLNDRYEVQTAKTINCMFELLDETEPDLILIDIGFKNDDGHEVVKTIKNNAKLKTVPLILVSTYNDSKKIDKILSLGAAAYVKKPFTTELLCETIERFFSKGSNDNQDLIEASEKLTILAVDDVASMLRAIYYALRNTYKVFMLSNPLELQDYLQGVKPDLFLLDYKMPGINGFDLIPIIREFPEHANTPIVFITSEGTDDYLREAMNLGACDYIVKPFEPENLLAIIDKHLRKNFEK